ncbi:hypothetical protein EDB83DRAFT_2521956 [Lactarius deliciosus]|nr:hypothetical protein EDB83DRAFT_2521956 [Lactarius deliciosus]
MPGNAVVDIRNTYGCSFIGMVISSMLFGITILQTWIYYWQYGNRDPKTLKLFIAVIFMMDTLHTILCVYSIYWYLVLNFGNVEVLGYNMWAMNFQILVSALVDCMVRLYYARRVYIVSRSIIIPVVIVVFVTISIALAPGMLAAFHLVPGQLIVFKHRVLVFPIRAAALKYWSLYTSLIPVTCIALGSGVAADILIAVTICWSLYHKKTGIAKQVHFFPIHAAVLAESCEILSYVDRPNTNPNSILATVVLISFATDASSMIWLIFFWPMSKFYVNALLAMLNSRDYISRDQSIIENTSNALDLSTIRIEQRRSEADESTSKPPAISLSVHRSATTDFLQPGNFDCCSEYTVDINKPAASIPSEAQSRISEPSV